jgi:uncharacterized protein (DUF2141 family)
VAATRTRMARTLGTAIAAAVLLTSAQLNAAPGAFRHTEASLTIRVTGFGSAKGQLMLALHNTRETFLTRKAPFRAATAAIVGDTVTYTFADVPPGKYSIAAFHDENANGDLDGVLRIPRERYGFSNNAHGRFGPPSYDATVFVLEATALTLDIRLRSAIER